MIFEDSAIIDPLMYILPDDGPRSWAVQTAAGRRFGGFTSPDHARFVMRKLRINEYRIYDTTETGGTA